MSQKDYNIAIVEYLIKTGNKGSHIRSLAKLLGTNQTTIARKTEELYKKNILDFRREGKNKVFYLKNTLEAKQFVYITELDKLTRTITKYPALTRVVEQIINNNKISLAILFGSYAKEIPSKDSDIDIYIDTSNRKIKEEVELIDSRISVKIGDYDTSSLLIKEIDTNHVIIKGAETYYGKNRFFS